MALETEAAGPTSLPRSMTGRPTGRAAARMATRRIRTDGGCTKRAESIPASCTVAYPTPAIPRLHAGNPDQGVYRAEGTPGHAEAELPVAAALAAYLVSTAISWSRCWPWQVQAGGPRGTVTVLVGLVAGCRWRWSIFLAPLSPAQSAGSLVSAAPIRASPARPERDPSRSRAAGGGRRNGAVRVLRAAGRVRYLRRGALAGGSVGRRDSALRSGSSRGRPGRTCRCRRW